MDLANQLRERRKSGRLSSADVEAIRQCTGEEPALATRTESSPEAEASRDALVEDAMATEVFVDCCLAAGDSSSSTSVTSSNMAPRGQAVYACACRSMT